MSRKNFAGRLLGADGRRGRRCGKVLVTKSGALEHLTIEINCNNENFSAEVLEGPLDIGPES
ncbi:MAG: hypothetical protein K2X93_03780 [Candidatus Obscuribacterales bacterium]|nr:hypothetical protein [Candidatus Obscuribacterales bacterium]